MFKLKCTSCESQKWSDGTTHYKVWFTTPRGGQAWLWSTQEYQPGADVDIMLITINSTDSKLSGKLGLAIG